MAIHCEENALHRGTSALHYLGLIRLQNLSTYDLKFISLNPRALKVSHQHEWLFCVAIFGEVGGRLLRPLKLNGRHVVCPARSPNPMRPRPQSQNAMYRMQEDRICHPDAFVVHKRGYAELEACSVAQVRSDRRRTGWCGMGFENIVKTKPEGALGALIAVIERSEVNLAPFSRLVFRIYK